MSDCLFCLVRRRDRSLSRSVVLILHEAAAQMLYIHWTPPPGTGRAQLPNAVAICKWERRQLGNISDVKGRLIPKTCSCLPGNVSHVRLWVFMKGGEGRVGGERGGLNMLGGKHLFMFSSWCIISKGSGPAPSRVLGAHQLETHCSMFRMLMHRANSPTRTVQRRDVRTFLRRNNNI